MSMSKQISPRRDFLGKIAAGLSAIGLLSIPASVKAVPSLLQEPNDEDDWFKQIKGKHRVVFDATRPHEIMPFAWPRVFLMTNQATGTPEQDNSVVVVLRHDAIPYAFEDRIWAKYNFGEMFKVDDPTTKKTATRNPFWKPEKGTFKVPGIGVVEIGIDELQASGVMFAVCNAAMTVYSAVVADNMKMDATEVKKDWEKGLLPGVQIVPSGVWAVGRAQEHKCAYCYAG